ncbi:interleukin-17 receptor E [Chaetodon trifascialis]|uniref:interleukin-17 receptor E n=1 Tax=Chaetodon trifascialis TaxID=109706 RepID=UPI0039939CCE
MLKLSVQSGGPQARKVLMMWGVALIFVSYAAAQTAAHEIKLECHEFHGMLRCLSFLLWGTTLILWLLVADFPPVENKTPSILVDLNVQLVSDGERYKMNISWAINIDASIEYLTATRIVIIGEPTYHCGYNPPLAKANLTQLTQIWFHYLISASSGYTLIQAANLPLPPPGSGLSYKVTEIIIPPPKPRVTQTTMKVPIVDNTTLGKTPQDTTAKLNGEAVPGDVSFTSTVTAIFGGLASLMILSFCYIIFKNCRSNFATSFGFKMLPASPVVPVPVLLVYPAENSAFQQAVVALAEFLQWHGGCSVAVDMWQQGKIAELGPMRWLAEQAKAADRVLIICPQPSSQPSDSLSNHSLPELSIPAAAHDLYPLILNMVASQAKSASDLAKFWVVQLGEQQAKRSCNPVLELRACKNFGLMKDLIKLCRSLHAQRQDSKEISNLIFSPRMEKNSVKLKEAVENLGGRQPSIVKELEPLKSVITDI